MNSDSPPIISLGLERLKSLPVRRDVWQLGFARMPTWITGERDQPFRPLVALCLSPAAGKLGNGDVCAPGDPLGPAAMAAVAQLAVTKGMGYRPERIEVRDRQLAEAVRADVASCGIELAIVERLDALDEAIASMMVRVGGKAVSTRFFDAGIEIARLRGFAEAAVEFHRAAPWNYLGDDDLIVVEAPAAPPGLGCFSVLGAADIERGLGFFASPAMFEQLQSGEPADPRVAAAGLWLMSLGEVVDWPIADSELWEEHALPLAGERAYSSLIGHLPKGRVRPADAARLSFVEALLRALSATTEDELDSGHWSRTVATSDGPITVALSLPAIAEAKPGASQRGAAGGGGVPDRRVMEQSLRDLQQLIASREFESPDELKAFLAKRGGRLPTHTPARTPQGKAQELVDRAFAERGRMRIKLAREALRLWPDCAEAWVLQAEQMPDPERRRDLYRSALEAAERTLGPKPFVEEVGHFWGVLETRPYMRARNGLAMALWDTDACDEALAHWLDLLRLCPGDNLGVRDMLVPRLLDAGRDAEAAEVLTRYEGDASAMLAYARVLLEFRHSGVGPAAQATLDAAKRRNPYVPKYLTSRAPMKGPLPDSYRLGSDDEARIATAVLFMAWTSTEGAIEWLSRSIRPPKSERRAQRAKGKQGRRR